MLKIAEDAEVILRTRVIQAEEKEPGTFSMFIFMDSWHLVLWKKFILQGQSVLCLTYVVRSNILPSLSKEEK